MDFKLKTSYQVSFKRTKITYTYKNDDFYEVNVITSKKKIKSNPWILFRELEEHIRMMAGFPKGLEGITIIEIFKNN